MDVGLFYYIINIVIYYVEQFSFFDYIGIVLFFGFFVLIKVNQQIVVFVLNKIIIIMIIFLLYERSGNVSEKRKEKYVIYQFRNIKEKYCIIYCIKFINFICL